MPAAHPPRTLWKHSLSTKWCLPVFTTSILRDVFSICSCTEIIQCSTCDGHALSRKLPFGGNDLPVLKNCFIVAAQ